MAWPSLGEQAPVQDEDNADSIENRLLAVSEHEVFDQSDQNEHLEERVATGFMEIHNQLTDMFNQHRHQ